MTHHLLTKWTMEPMARISGTWLLLIAATLTGMDERCAQAETPVQPPAGLVGWWPGNGNANDIVGGNHGTLYGAASFVPGKVNQAFGLGPGGFVDVPRDPAIFALTEGTVEMWFRILDLDAAVRLFEIAESGVAFPDSDQWGIDYRGDDGGAIQVHLVRDGTGVFTAFTPPVINDTNFHHVAVVADGVGTIEIYVDGVSRPVVAPFWSLGDGFLGHAPNANNMKFGAIERNDLRAEGNKVIDEVRIFNRPLSASEIQAIFNTGPTANAGPDQSIRAGDTVELDGSASCDDNTLPEFLVYNWIFDSKPVGSSAAFDDATSWMPSFVADKVGTYTISLFVTDEAGLSSALDTVVISTTNLAPTAVATVDYTLAIIGQPVYFDGSNSTDPEDDPLLYEWIITAAPPGSTAQLVGDLTATPTLTPDKAGDYKVTLLVDDYWGEGTPTVIEFTAMTVTGFAEYHILAASDQVAALTSAQVTTKGNQTAFGNFLSEAIKSLQKGKVSQAVAKLNQAIQRTDGCPLRGTPDGNGPGMDWITDCAAQHAIYDMLTAAVDALQD